MKKHKKSGVLALVAALIVASLVDTSFGSPAYPLQELLERAETVLVVRKASHTETNAVFEVIHVLRGDPKLQELSLGGTRIDLDFSKNTPGLLLFSQGDNYWGKPKDSFQIGQPIKEQVGYRGWMLMDGPSESKEELERLKVLVKQNPYKPDLHGKSSDKTTTQAIHDSGRALLDTAGGEDMEARRRAAADLSILLMKCNGVWREFKPRHDNWKIPTEAGIRLEVDALHRSDQEPNLALANMASHCMGMLVTGAWQTPPKGKDDGLEAAVIRLVRRSDDPAVKVILLVGLASSKTAAARDAVVVATANPDAGVRKSAVYLVERGTANYFGPIGCIHIGSPTKDVDAAGRKIRAIYKWDKTVGAGWGPMRDGLQTRIEIDDDTKPVGRDFRVSLIVRNVADKPLETPSQAHPIRYFKVLTQKEILILKTEHIPDVLPPKTIEPGKQVVFWSFVLNDYFELESPGVYEAWLPDTYGALPPRSNRVRLRVEPSNKPRDRRPAEEEPSNKTTIAVARLKKAASIESISVRLEYYGPDRGDVVHSLMLNPPHVAIDAASTLIDVALPKERAVRIIDHLADLGFFDRAKEFALLEAPPRAGSPKGPTYALMVEYSIKNEKWHCYYLDLGWNWQMLQFLDDCRKCLVDAEAKAMDKLLAQLQPERKRWQAAEEATIERLLSIRAAKWSDAEGYEAHKQLVDMGPDAVPSLLICFKKAANRDPRVLDPQKVSDFDNELQAALYALRDIGDRRALPAISALVKYDNKPRRMQSALEDILARGSDQQLWVDIRSDDPNIADGAQRILASPEQYGRAERREPRESEADIIVVVRAVERRDKATTVEVLKTLKGSSVHDFMRISDLRVGRQLPIDQMKKKRWICYLRVDKHYLVPEPILRSEWYIPWTEKTEPDVLAAIPLPTKWGPPSGNAQMGLRVRTEKVPAGADVLVEIAVRNTGEKPIELSQHRFNIYDCYPRTRFTVTDDTGRRTLLAKPKVPVMKESDKPWGRSLAPGEVYIHTVRLNRWPVAAGGLGGRNATNPLGTPGTYTIECTYADPPYTSRPLTLTTAPVKVTITAAENPVAEPREEAAKTGNEGGLSARIILPDVIKPVDGVFPAKLELTNNGKQPVRVATLCQAWRSSSKGAFHVSLKPDRWKSDRPSADQSAKSVVVLSPGESTSIPFKIVDGDGETLHVTASYGVLDEFAKKLNVWSRLVKPERVVLKRVEQGELRLLCSDEFPLPSTQVSIRWAFSQPQVFAVVCEAVSDARAFRFYDLTPDGVRGKSQVFKVTEVLAGETAATDDATFDYFVLDGPGAHERTIRKGERVIWVARPWTYGDVDVEDRPHCLKVLRDTPGNRRFVRVAYANRRTLPGGRMPLEEAIRGGFAFVVACEALEHTQGEIGAEGKLNCTQEFWVHQLLAGDGPGIGKFRLHYTYGDVHECRERAVRKRDRVIWIVREKPGDAPPWHGTKALPDSPQNRQTVVAALAKEQGKEVVPFLIELLQDPRKQRRYLAADMLGGIGPEAKAAIGALIAALEDPARSVRALAADALGKVGTDTELIVTALRKAEKDEDLLVRTCASRALDSLTKLLGKQLRSKDWNEEAAAIRSTSALIEDCPRAELHRLSPLVEPLFSKVGWGGIARDHANQAAESIARVGKPAVPFLLEKLKSPESHDRWCAIEILGRIGEPDAPVVSVVRPMLHDEDAYVRRVAIDTLAALGNRARPAVEDLEEVLTNSTPNNRIRGHAALIRITGEAGGHIEAIAEHLKSRDMWECEASFAAATLGGFGAVARPVESHLRAALKHPHAQVRVDAAGALGAIGAESEETIVALIGQLRNDSDPVARRSSAYALGEIGPAAKAAVPALSDILNSEDVDKALRRTAAEAIKRIRQPAAPPDAKSAKEPQKQPAPEEQVRPMFSGRVVHPDGTPAEAVDVHVYASWSGNPDLSPNYSDFEGTGTTFRVKTDDLGKFAGVLWRPIKRDWKEKIDVKATAWLADRSMGGVTRSSTNTGTAGVGPLKVVLAKTGSVTIGLLDPAGDPVENAEISASDLGPWFSPYYSGPVEYLGNGHCRMSNLIAGFDYKISGTAPGHRTGAGNAKEFVLKPGEERDVGTLTLDWWGKKAVPGLIERLKSPDSFNRQEAAGLLGQFGTESAEAVGTLREVLRNDKRYEVRWSMAAALGNIGPSAGAAVPDLIETLRKDAQTPPRREAAKALGSIGDSQALPAVKAALKDERKEVREAAADAIRRIQTPIKAVYFSGQEGQLSKEDLASHPEVIAVDNFSRVKKLGRSPIAIWIDKDAVKDVDLKWLHKPPQKYYPIVLVGYRNALYSFRDALSGFGIGGPDREWEKVTLTPGFSIWMKSAIVQGYEDAPTVAGILKITAPLLEKSLASDTVPWGKVSNGLQCRLSPDTQTATVRQGAKPEEIIVHANYDVRNAGDRALRFSPTGTPLWGSSCFRVTGPDGKEVRYTGVKSEVRPPVPPEELAAGEILRRQVRLHYNFTRPGKYLVRTRKESTPDGPEIMAYYGNDADKARQNPDNVWTGSLVSNTVTVEMAAGKNPEHALLPGSHLTLKEACGEKFEHAALWEALNEPDSSDHQRSEAEKKAGVFHFGQEYRLVDSITGKREPRLDLPSPYRCDRGAGERPIQKGERVIWIFQRTGHKERGLVGPAKALPVTFTNIEAIVDAVQGMKRWGPASSGIQAGIRCKAVNPDPEPGVVLVLSIRNVGAKPVRLLNVGSFWGRSVNCQSIEVKVHGKLYPFCGPQAKPPGPPGVDSFIELPPGAVDSAEVRTCAANWGLKGFRGAEMTFVYANDSTTSDASPYDQESRKWREVTGLWTGTARSGTIKLNAAEAKQKSTSSEQPSPIRTFRSVVAQEHFELKPISGLAPEKLKRLQDLARRFHEQERNARSLPHTAKIIVLEEELGKFLSVSDLVAVTDCQYERLSSTAFHLLRGTSNAALSKQDIAKLLEHLPDRETHLSAKGLLASHVLAENERFGAPALAGVLRRSSDPLSRVHAAAGLAAGDSKADAALRREAESLLLASLGNDDDTARIAHNALTTLKPWMIEWLLERLGDPGASTAFWNNATSRLSTCNPKGFEKRLKQLFVDAESHASVNVRINATNGLRHLGLTKADAQLYRHILKDENPHVRRMLYAGLFQLKEPWAAPLLTAGLEDRLPENVGICADALAALDHKPAVPKLIATLRRDDLDTSVPPRDAYRRVGQATVKLADLGGYDFRLVGRPVGSMYSHAMVIENRDEIYRKECIRLLNWWKTTGSGLKWDQ